uniref:Uncharacterized protein n=1 Tax=Salix viminalis TaxID=40686 RepID=A0A6N2ML05_SALVM
MDQKDSMVKSYNEEKLQQIAHDYFAKISLGHGKATQQLLAKREELVKCEKQLQQREVQNECERSKLLLEKKMPINPHLSWSNISQDIIMRQQPWSKKADISALRLAEEQRLESKQLCIRLRNNRFLFCGRWPMQREKEKLHRKITELEKKLDAKQALELKIECMENALQVMKHMGEDEGLDIKTRMDTA